MNEIEEFYSYIEMPQVAENMKAWEGSFHDGTSVPPKISRAPPNAVSAGEWTKSSISKRRAHVDYLLESLEHRDTEIRFTNARRLFYVLQGNPFRLHVGSLLKPRVRDICGDCVAGTSITLDI